MGQHRRNAQDGEHRTTTESYGLMKQKCVYNYGAYSCDAPSVVSEGRTANRTAVLRQEVTA
ncbi:MAG: hypothetical protein ACC656_02690 [Candidatus Heimdallarchaeota archaeon]